MNNRGEFTEKYEKLSWLIICESLFIFFAFLFSKLPFLKMPDSIQLLIIMFMSALQLPAIDFVSYYASKRVNVIKKFIIKVIIVLIVVISIIFYVILLIKALWATLVGTFFLIIGIWLMYFPPKWFKKFVKKWNKNE